MSGFYYPDSTIADRIARGLRKLKNIAVRITEAESKEEKASLSDELDEVFNSLLRWYERAGFCKAALDLTTLHVELQSKLGFKITR